MVTGIAFLLLAGILLAVVAYEMLLARSQVEERIERRLAQELRGSHVDLFAPPRGAVQVPDILAPLLARAQIRLTSRTILTIAAGFGIALVTALLLGGPIAALAVAIVVPGGLLFYLRQRADKRTQQLIDDLPFFIDGVRQLVAIGNSLPQALSRALPTAPDTVREFLESAIRRIELGAPIAEALHQVAQRIEVAEISMFASAVRVNSRYGGPLNQILSNISSLIRERVRVRREIASATAEVRVSAKLLAALPIVLALFFLISNRAYLDFFLTEERGRNLAMLAIGLQLTGAAIMARAQRLSF